MPSKNTNHWCTAEVDVDFPIPNSTMQHEMSGLENVLALPCRLCPLTKLLAIGFLCSCSYTV